MYIYCYAYNKLDWNKNTRKVITLIKYGDKLIPD